jgi:hypothetical protein
MWVVALDTREAKALLHAPRVVYVSVCRDDTTTSRRARTSVAGIAKLIDLRRGKEERGTKGRM